MLISEVTGRTAEDIIKEGDMLTSVLNTLILEIKPRLEKKQKVWNLEQVLGELNRRSGLAYINPENEDIKNTVIQAFEEQGLSVERGSGEITLAQASDIDTSDPKEVVKQNKTAEVQGKAMDKLKNKADGAGL